MERGCRKGARVWVWAALCHVVFAAASGLGLFFRVGGTAPRAKPGSASAACRLLAARGRHLSRLLVQVSQPALRRLGIAGKGGQPVLTPGPAMKETRESGRGRGRQGLANGVQRILQETDGEGIRCLGGPFCLCVLKG